MSHLEPPPHLIRRFVCSHCLTPVVYDHIDEHWVCKQCAASWSVAIDHAPATAHQGTTTTG